jgi:DNA-binding GntR family transcriptional regulator
MSMDALSRMRYRCNMAAADVAYDFTKQRILDGRLTGGDMISEGEIAAGVGLSRTPVREAFLRLETEGLLRLYPKRGALVVPVSAAEIESVMETRMLVERHAIEKVVRSRADVADALEEQVRRQADLVAVGDAAAFVESDREFHRVFVEAAGNPILLQLHDSLRDRQSRMGLAALARDARRMTQIVEEHRDLVAAVAETTPGRAVRAIERHLAGTLKLLRSA